MANRIALDSGALIKLSNGDPLTRVLSSRVTAVTVVDVSENAGRDAGERLGAAGMPPQNTVDALIVASAVAERAEHILTGDPADVGPLAGADLTIVEI